MRYARIHKPPIPRKSISKTVKEKLWREQCGSCFYCGRTLYQFEAWHYREGNESLTCFPVIDHKQSLASGGADSIENMCVACFECNAQKSDMNAEEFRERGPKRVNREYGGPWDTESSQAFVQLPRRYVMRLLPKNMA